MRKIQEYTKKAFWMCCCPRCYKWTFIGNSMLDYLSKFGANIFLKRKLAKEKTITCTNCSHNFIVKDNRAIDFLAVIFIISGVFFQIFVGWPDFPFNYKFIHVSLAILLFLNAGSTREVISTDQTR